MLGLGLTAAAFCTAALSGIAGLGGGTILIGLFYAAGLTPVQAVPLFAAVQLVSNGSRVLAYVRHVHWGATGWFLLASVPATFVVAPWIERIDANWVQILLALLILVSLIPARGGEARAPLPPRTSFIVAGLLNGAFGLVVGATGLLVGRLFLRPEWRRETTLGTMALTQALGHLLRVLAYGFVGFSAFTQPRLLLALCAAVIAGTWLGRRLNAYLDEERFALLFKTLLVLLSIKLLWEGGTNLLAGRLT
ncbi:MAG: sulfite exporter TauE/SafE family protein [Hydrocarboniphaga sp.]|uniref:sulfite exporter TauE/SafE family protein n=1 Tax=Hydrocarboniphaga sp. TaxID=2033016 RepID=UPI00261AF67C|nr:sulfite exporter TauE/SafE family protein [Hydrocarboniphaga sp.]MDB5969256.1 sulfite exporter TauE/SafE family protein [Hydrocarboniphaga sp.]